MVSNILLFRSFRYQAITRNFCDAMNIWPVFQHLGIFQLIRVYTRCRISSAAMCNVGWTIFFAAMISNILDATEGECSMNHPCPLRGWSKLLPADEIYRYPVINYTRNVLHNFSATLDLPRCCFWHQVSYWPSVHDVFVFAVWLLDAGLVFTLLLEWARPCFEKTLEGKPCTIETQILYKNVSHIV